MQVISILIVEDEAVTAMVMEMTLKSKGYNVLKSVSSGEKAVDSALTLNPDLVLMDIRLAGKMNGIEAMAIIKAESSKKIQFIFTTGYSEPELKQQAMNLEPLEFFTKPVNMAELINFIESFFKGK